MPLNRPPTDLNVALLDEKFSDFVRFQVWPLRTRLDPQGWLSNFSPADLPLARHLLNAFMFFSEDLTRQIFVSALQAISMLPQWRAKRTGDLFGSWADFNRRFYLTYVTGETPNPADSGMLFARKARDHADVGSVRILTPEEALRRYAVLGDQTPLVFVDDFVGSGNQFCDTWERQYVIDGKFRSFKDVSAAAVNTGNALEVYYAPAVCTDHGLREIGRSCAGVVVSAGNILDSRYSVFHPKSLVWPEGLVDEGAAMVKRVSLDLGLPENGTETGLFGFHKLGLALGFAHKTPDATIPLFRIRDGGWKPLVRDV